MSTTGASLDDLFRELLDLIAGECGVKPLPAAQPLPGPLHHTAGDDLHPVIGVLAAGLAPRSRRRCPGVGSRCGVRTVRLSPAGYCPACHRRWVRMGKPGRLEEYVELTRDIGVPMDIAAKRMGVCERTARRYEADLRQAGAGVTERQAA